MTGKRYQPDHLTNSADVEMVDKVTEIPKMTPATAIKTESEVKEDKWHVDEKPVVDVVVDVDMDVPQNIKS